MDLKDLLPFAPLLTSIVIPAAALYVGKVAGDLRLEMFKDGEARERRIVQALNEMREHLENKLDGKADKIVVRSNG